MNLKINNTYKQTAIKITMMAIIGIALLLTTIALSLPYYNSLARAQMKNQTSSANNKGIGNVNTIPNITNIPPGNNTQIIMKNKNIGNPNAFTAFGKEHGVTASGNLTTPTTKSNSSNATTSTNATVGNKTAGKYP